MPAVASGSLLAFAMSMDDVVISIFINGPRLSTLPIKVYTQIKTGVTPEINALCTIMLAFTVVILLVYSLMKKLRGDAVVCAQESAGQYPWIKAVSLHGMGKVWTLST